MPLASVLASFYTARIREGTQVIVDLDQWRTANRLVTKQGDYAVIVAARRADAALAAGDIVGLRVWRSIVRAIRELQRIRRDESERVN